MNDISMILNASQFVTFDVNDGVKKLKSLLYNDSSSKKDIDQVKM
jgi:hypothetical protein